MRLFAALDLPAAVADSLAERVAAARQTGLQLRWVPREEWHLTLAFYGTVPDERVDELATRLRRAAARCAPLELELGAAELVGSARRTRVLWCAVTGDQRGLVRLAASSRAAGRRVGLDIPALAPDVRFRPHVTVARVPRAGDVRAAVEAMNGGPAAPGTAEPVPRWTAEQLALVRSDLGDGPGGRPVHRVLGLLPLGHGSDAASAQPS